MNTASSATYVALAETKLTVQCKVGSDMDLPKFNETFLPILDVLKNGESTSGRELIRRVEDKFYSKLPQQLLDQTIKSGSGGVRSFNVAFALKFR